jgi:hypothetical protein
MDTCSSRHASPLSENCSIGLPAQRTGGTPTDDDRLCITDDRRQTIPTAATSPISPALDRLSCVLLMAHRQDKRIPIPRHLPPFKNSGTRRHGYHLEGHETGSLPKETNRQVRSPMSQASFSPPRHTVDPPRLHSLRFSPMITDHCAGSAEVPGAGLSPWSP